MASPRGEQCNISELKTFPNTLSFPINADRYMNGTYNSDIGTYNLRSPGSLNIKFDHAANASAPNFDDSGKGTLKTADIDSSLTYLNSRYTLISVQISKPLHNLWVIPLIEQRNNKEDIVLTYSNDYAVPNTPKIIIINIPIIRSDVTTYDPQYLKFLADPNQDTTAVSIEDLFPKTRQNDLYAYYTICAQGFEASDPPQDVLAIIFVNGKYVSNTIMNNIKIQFGSTSDSYASYEAPLGLKFPPNMGSFDNQAFDKNVKHGFNLTETMVLQSGTLPQNDISSYKCVPFDPERDVKDGKISYDPAKGVLHDFVQAEREILKAEATSTTTPIMEPAEYFDSVSGFMGVILTCIILGIIGFLIFSNVSTDGVQSEQTGWVTRITKNILAVPSLLIVGILAGFIGYMIGMSVSTPKQQLNQFIGAAAGSGGAFFVLGLLVIIWNWRSKIVVNPYATTYQAP